MVDCTLEKNKQVTGCCTTADSEQCKSIFSDKNCSCVLQLDGSSQCGYLEDGYFWSCPSRCCEKGKGCPGECIDNPPETAYSGQTTAASDTPSTDDPDDEDEKSCPAGCEQKPDDDEPFLQRKEMLVVYAILMAMPLMIWFTGIDIKVKSFVTLIILLGLGLYIPLVLLPKYKQA